MRAAYNFIHSLSSRSDAAAPVTLSRFRYRMGRRRVVYHSGYVLGRLRKGRMSYRYDRFDDVMSLDGLYLFQPESLLVSLAHEVCEVDYCHLDVESVRWILQGLEVCESVIQDIHFVKINNGLSESWDDLTSAMRFRPWDSALQNEILIDVMDVLVDQIEQRQTKNAACSGAGKISAGPGEAHRAKQAERARVLLEKDVPLSEIVRALDLGDETDLKTVFEESWMFCPHAYQTLARRRNAP